MVKPLAVVLVSGGMDSCVTAAIAHQNYRLAFLHINYGQRTEKRELEAFIDIANYYKVKKRLVCNAEYFKDIGGSSLTDERIEISKFKLYSKGIPSSYVPFRNAGFLAIAISWAEVIGATKVFIGAVEDDSSGYPDCRKTFYEVFNKLIKEGTNPATEIEIITPIISLKKSEIVRKGVELKAPLHLTWSCYKNNDIACGECDSCVLRLTSFKKVGLADLIRYQHYLE